MGKGWEDEAPESGRKHMTSERPGARSEQEEEAEEHGDKNLGSMSVAELCLDPSKRAIQCSPRLISKGSFQSLFQDLLCKKPF